MKKLIKVLPLALVLTLLLSACTSDTMLFSDVEVRVYNTTNRPISFSAYLAGDYHDNGEPIVKLYPGESTSVIIDHAYARYGDIVNVHLCSPYTSSVVHDYAVSIESDYIEVEVSGPSYSPAVYIDGLLVY